MSQTAVEKGLLDQLEFKMIRLTKFFHYVGQVMILAMMMLTVVSSLGRYFFKYPLPGSVEVTCLMMIVMTFMLGPYTLAIDGHINITIFTDRVSDRGKRGLEVFANALILVIASLGFVRSIKQGIFIASTGTYTAVLHIGYAPFYYIVAVGWFLLALVALIHLLLSILRMVKNE